MSVTIFHDQVGSNFLEIIQYHLTVRLLFIEKEVEMWEK